MVVDVQPVAHVRAVAVQRHLLAVHQVGDEQRDDLLGELVGAVVVRAPRDADRAARGCGGRRAPAGRWRPSRRSTASWAAAAAPRPSCPARWSRRPRRSRRARTSRSRARERSRAGSGCRRRWSSRSPQPRGSSGRRGSRRRSAPRRRPRPSAASTTGRSRMSPSTNRSRSSSATGARFSEVARVGELVEHDDALGLGPAPGAGQHRTHVVAADEPGSAGDQELHGDLLSDASVAAIPETIGVRANADVRGHATERSRRSRTW